MDWRTWAAFHLLRWQMNLRLSDIAFLAAVAALAIVWYKN